MLIGPQWVKANLPTWHGWKIGLWHISAVAHSYVRNYAPENFNYRFCTMQCHYFSGREILSSGFRSRQHTSPSSAPTQTTPLTDTQIPEGKLLQDTTRNWIWGPPCAWPMTNLQLAVFNSLQGLKTKLSRNCSWLSLISLLRSFAKGILIPSSFLQDAERMSWYRFISTAYLWETLQLGKPQLCFQFQWKRGEKKRTRKSEGKEDRKLTVS